jgi:crotonobetainyl-CoA:carnitine CoA-transferase CaiB-like acyl-CoA transferase
MGARVIKVEPPERGDSLRWMGPTTGGRHVWFSTLGRNKESIELDLKSPEGRDLCLRIIARADILVENYRPGVLGRLGLSDEALLAANRALVIAHVSGWGQTGPRSTRPGFGKVAEAFSGATHLTGLPDQPPTHPSYSLGDVTTGMLVAMGCLAAQRHAQITGEGQVIDVALYEALFRMIDWQLPVTLAQETPVARTGGSFPFDWAFVTGIFDCRDHVPVVVSAATDAMVRKLAEFLVAQDCLEASELEGRPNPASVDAALRTWCATVDCADALRVLSEDQGLVAGPVLNPRDLFEDGHVAARQDISWVPVAPAPDAAVIPQPSPVPKFSRTPGRIRHAGPALGEHSAAIAAEFASEPDAADRADEPEGVAL